MAQAIASLSAQTRDLPLELARTLVVSGCAMALILAGQWLPIS